MRGLILEGGGAKGAYQIGAWKALRELGIDFEGVAGTSIGALNGAFVVQDDFDAAWQLWFNLEPEQVVAGDAGFLNKIMKLNLDRKDFPRALKAFQKVVGQGGLDVSPLRQVVATHLNEASVRASDKVFGFVTVSLTDFKPLDVYKEDIPEGQMAEYLMTSANFPAFKLERLDGKLFVDGGFYDNQPIRLLVDKGFDELVVIGLKGIGIRQGIPKSAKHSDLKMTVIEPTGDLGNILDFSNDNVRKNLKMGYYDAMKVMRGLRGTYYYIEYVLPERYYFQWLAALEPTLVEELAVYFGLPGSPGFPVHRCLFEQLIPKLMSFEKLGNRDSYRELILGIFEAVGRRMDIDRYSIMTDNEFIGLILDQNQSSHQLREGSLVLDQKLPKLIRQSGVYWSSNRADVIQSLFEGLVRCKP